MTKILARAVICVQVTILGLALFATPTARAAASLTQEPQYNPAKARKSYLKQQKKQGKKTRKAEKKQEKEFKKHHSGGF